MSGITLGCPEFSLFGITQSYPNSFLFFKLLLGFGLDVELGLGLTLGINQGLEFGLASGLGLGLERSKTAGMTNPRSRPSFGDSI